MPSKTKRTSVKKPAAKKAALKKPTTQQQLDAIKGVLGRLDELVEALKPHMDTEALDEAAALQADIRALKQV